MPSSVLGSALAPNENDFFLDFSKDQSSTLYLVASSGTITEADVLGSAGLSSGEVVAIDVDNDSIYDIELQVTGGAVAGASSKTKIKPGGGREAVLAANQTFSIDVSALPAGGTSGLSDKVVVAVRVKNPA